MVARNDFFLTMEERQHANMDLPSKYDYMMKLQPLDSDDNSSTSSRHMTMKSSNSVVSADTLPSWHGDSSRRPLHENLSYHDTTHLSFGNNTLVFTTTRRKNPVYIAVVVFSLIGLLMYSRSHAILHSALAQASTLSLERRNIHSQFRIVEHDLRKFQRTIVRLSQRQDGKKTTNNSETNKAVGEMMSLQENIKGVNDKRNNLQKHIQDVSRRDASTKYGHGVIRVEIDLEFPTSSEGPTSMVIEMAPLALMPHSVFMFLEMVNNHLYDGCSFILNSQDAIKAAPLPYNGSSAAVKVKRFARLGLDSIAFREYSPEYPNEQYTLGFALDGSPSFYINIKDNTEVHNGDPCFAKIISGFDTVHRLEKTPVRKDGVWYKQRVGIRRAVIL